MKLTLLRHGETHWNREKRIQGTQNIPLTQNGMKQIEQRSYQFRTEGLFFDKIISSPLLRAKQSAMICSGILGLPFSTDTSFQERGFGLLEGQTKQWIQWRYVMDCEEIKESIYCVESSDELANRVNIGLDELKRSEDDSSVLLITHGSVIKKIGELMGMKIEIIENAAYVELFEL